MKHLKLLFLIAFSLLFLQLVVKFGDPTAMNINFNSGSSILGIIQLNPIKFVSTLIFLFVITYIFKIKVNFKLKNWSKILIWGFPALILALLNMTLYSDHIVWKTLLYRYSIINTLSLLVLGLVSAFVVAFFEEIIFRGAIMGALMNYFKQYSVLLSVLISSLLFSSVHAINYLNEPFWDTTNQIIYAFGIGMLFASIYYLTSNLWITIILHTSIDASSFIFNMHSAIIDSGETSHLDLASVIIFFIFTLFAYILLRLNTTSNDLKDF